MALSLGAELLAAQTNISRRPLVEITAGNLGNDFPFVGNAISNPDSKDQGKSTALFLSDGRFVIIYTGYDGADEKEQLRYIVSDAEFTSFSSYVAIDTEVLEFNYLDALLMGGGNVAVAAQLSTTALVFYTVSTAGAKLTETKVTGLSGLNGITVTTTATGYVAIYITESGGTYTINKRTSTDFVTWSSASAVTIPDLSTSDPVQDPSIKRLADGSWFLALSVGDTNDIYNIQYSTSTDLSTWVSIADVTSDTPISRDYHRPSFVQKSDASLFMAIEEVNSYLTMTSSTSGWDTTDQLTVYNAWVDNVNSKLYVTAFWTSGWFAGAAKIDIDTWTIDTFYDTGTTPPVPPIFGHTTGLTSQKNGNKIADNVVCIHKYAHNCACVIDFDADTIVTYYFEDYSGSYAGASQNVTHSLDNDPYAMKCESVCIADGKIWFVFDIHRGISSAYMQAGYIDLSGGGPPYTFNLVYSNTDIETDFVPEAATRTWISIYPTESKGILCGSHTNTSIESGLIVFSLSSDETLKCYNRTDYSMFPKMGTTSALMIGDVIYCIPVWDESISPDAAKWGLLEIDTTNDVMTYHYPAWATEPGNYLRDMVEDSAADELIIRTTHGCCVFNYTSKTWEQFENTNLESMPPDSSNTEAIGYDTVSENFFYSGNNALYLVPRDGLTNSVKYVTGTYTTSWGFSNPVELIVGNDNSNPYVALSSGDLIYATWKDDDTINWAKQASYLELIDYLTDEVVLDMNMEDPFKLTFTLAMGHLFDPLNTDGLLRTYVSKGMTVHLRFGELVSSVEYWTDQGYYTIRGLRVNYSPTGHPTITVSCEDDRALWDMHQVAATNVTATTPEEALDTIITDNTPFETADLTIPEFPLSVEFDAQWVDNYLKNIIDDIAHRFQHFCCMGMDGGIVFRPIDLTASSVNTHGKAVIVDFSPDDDDSDLTNRITVTGESQYEFEQLLDEERVTGLSGTIGWYGFDKDFTVWYSDDKSAVVKNPRLEVIETSTSILFQLVGQITEEMTDEDVDFKYCVITVEAPDLVPVLIGAIALYAAGNLIGDGVSLGMTIPIGRKIEGVGLYLALMVLGSMGNFNYDIYGQPVSYVKREYTATVDDEELQTETGMVVENVIPGFVCYTPADCNTVAQFEMGITQAQRRKISVRKTAHLADEVGDMVTVTHPFSEVGLDVFVTAIERRYKPSNADNDGYFTDTISGWRK